jgi:hypothetical protein
LGSVHPFRYLVYSLLLHPNAGMNWFVDVFNFYIGYHRQMQDTPPQELRFSTRRWIYHDGALSAECLATATPSTRHSLEVSMLAYPTRAYSASSSGSCSFCALVQVPTRSLGSCNTLGFGSLGRGSGLGGDHTGTLWQRSHRLGGARCQRRLLGLLLDLLVNLRLPA